MSPPDIVAVPLAEKPALWAMFQDYAAELAPMAGLAPVDGTYPYRFFDSYWQDKDRWPYWAIARERIGFALVRYAAEFSAMQMAEFYILPAHRRSNLGLSFARALLVRHPGPWRIRQMAANTRAVSFWHRVEEPYGFSETEFVVDGVPRIEQSLTVG